VEIIEITEQNIDKEHICCAIGKDKENENRAFTKKAWMKKNFRDGLVFRRLDDRGKVFIEYLPIEMAWKPVIGVNYLMINCLWVAGKFKEQGWANRLLDLCIQDAKSQGKAGIAVVTSGKKKSFLTDKTFFQKKGFVTLDKAPPYFELMALKLKNGPVPAFSPSAKNGTIPIRDGLVLVYSNQCPFMEDYATITAQRACEDGFSVTLRKLENAAEAKEFGSPFGTLGIYYNGTFQTHIPTSWDKLQISIQG